MRSFKQYILNPLLKDNKALNDAFKVVMACGSDDKVFQNYALGTIETMCELRDGEVLQEELIIDNGKVTYTGDPDVFADRMEQNHNDFINIGFVMCRANDSANDVSPIIWINSVNRKIYYGYDLYKCKIPYPRSMKTVDRLVKLLIDESVLKDDKYIKYTVIL